MNGEGVLTDEDIIAKTNEVFVREFEIEPERLRPDQHLFTDLGLDSLDTVDLVVALQDAFGVTIRSDARVRGIRTLGDVYEFIRSVRGKGGSV